MSGAPLRRHGAAHALQALRAIVLRETLKFVQQTGRLVSALVRPLLWLAVFAAGFRNVFGVAIVAPYDTYVPYEVYIAPGLVGMVLLFNGMQSSLAMVYDREMGLMRLLLTAPLPRPWLLFSKLCATALLSVLQALVFVAVALLIGTDLPLHPLAAMHALLALAAGALMLGALGLLLSVHIRQLENFAGTMNFVIFPMYFLSSALYPLWKLQESGAEWVYQLARLNPFTHAVEWIRFALYGKDPGLAPWVVLGCGAVFFFLACWGYDPQRGFGGLTRRGDGA
ncbi:multidrug ABC transporter permease [Verminephrobacter aporrectodeae subsp. tuberculatae]|uniref:ABC transporter permease n=1 Tax=Verminephrobacter aporrectodeae TaxID=1110389 RepID=UPI0022436A04|nr:ABC transporter permease [Verminephrobacter aporrectodeae]MCW8198997.1 multidrug ABC transporter permease [Verminephrobacter aporrectodeae subsp. tuberculatae]